MKTSNSSDNVSDSSDIDYLKEIEINKIQHDWSIRKLTDTKLKDPADDLTSNASETRRRVTLKEFNMVKLVGKGSFGKVIIK